jgi:(p)ppGpp synthase/HD superfamily hydrolase
MSCIDMLANIREAREFALKAHGNQKYGEQPYSVHLESVAELLVPFGEEAQMLGYLHDVVEDTKTRIEEIEQRFGQQIARCVELLTDEPGKNRRERRARTNAKLSQVGKEDELALIVKAADRLANLRASVICSDQSKLQMYRKEHPAFKQAVFRKDLCDDLWQEMSIIVSS